MDMVSAMAYSLPEIHLSIPMKAPKKRRSPTGKGLSLPRIGQPAESMPHLRQFAMADKKSTKKYNVRGFARASSEKQADWDKKLRGVNDKRAALIEEKKVTTRDMIVHKQHRKDLRIKARIWFRIYGWYLSLKFWEKQFDSLAVIRTDKREQTGAANCIQTRWKTRNDWKLEEFHGKLGQDAGWRLIFGAMINSRARSSNVITTFLQDHHLVYKLMMVKVIMKKRFSKRIHCMQKFAVGYMLCTQARVETLGKLFDKLWEKAVRKERKRIKLARRDAAETAEPEDLVQDKRWDYIDRHLTKKLNKFLDGENKIVTSTSWYKCPQSIRRKILRRYLLKCRVEHIKNCTPAYAEMQRQSELEKSGRRNYTLEDIKSMMSLDPRHSSKFAGAVPSSPTKRQSQSNEPNAPPGVVLEWPELHIYTNSKGYFQTIITKTIRQLQNMSASQRSEVNRRASDVMNGIERVDLSAVA
jgi:hypothetical protein